MEGNMTLPFSYLSSLTCATCHQAFPVNQIQTFCLECQSPLLVNYDLEAVKVKVAKSEIAARPRGMWRWHELLPVKNEQNVTSLGEGDTPLLEVPHLADNVGLATLWLKDESQNPTGSFKARGMSAAISRALELGISQVIVPTAGNAGGAMAAYAARAGLRARIYMPADTPISNQLESRICGAEVILVEGLISDAAKEVHSDTQSEAWFDLSTFKEPYRTEGKKIMGYELAEGFGWRLPDVIIYPTGGGTGLIGMWKAFSEMVRLGWLESSQKPRMVVVQAEGCAPVVKAFKNKQAACEFWPDAATMASGLRVPKSFADRLIMTTIGESNGCALAVSDQEIQLAWKEMASEEGIFAAPEGAATYAALKILLRDGWITPDERVVLFNTGSGLKYIDTYSSAPISISA
jgi:threonine synthase